eukprot:1235460-Amphidinium_carterae.1
MGMLNVSQLQKRKYTTHPGRAQCTAASAKRKNHLQEVLAARPTSCRMRTLLLALACHSKCPQS